MKGTFREKLSKSFILGTLLPALGMILLVAAVAYASGGAEGRGPTEAASSWISSGGS
jgi:hypothetical protein